MSRDKLLIARSSSKNNGVANANEAASTNAIVVPPGLYDVEFTFGAVTGAPTSISVEVQESGYLPSDVTKTLSAGFQSLVDQRIRTLAAPYNTVSNRFFLRGVRMTLWNVPGPGQANAGVAQPNAGIAVTLNGGTTPTVPKLQATFWPSGRAPQWNGLP
jgi:hypothetical protein